MSNMDKILELIKAERLRQISEGHSTACKDDDYTRGELAGAAACYTMFNTNIQNLTLRAARDKFIKDYWPWSEYWWKPTTSKRDLIKAGALIVAELERLERKDETN